jgi:Uma2 family endonuclease
MATQPVFEKPVSVEEYLSTVYEHDCEYVDGVIEERDLGEFEHAYIQGLLIGSFLKNREAWGVYPLPEQRVQTEKTHFRVPDVVVLREGSIREPILTHPPLLAVEVQSPDIPLRKTELKAAEYLAFGIEHVWVIDPYARVAYRGMPNGLELVRSGELSIPGTPIRLSAQELFAELDRV